MTPINNDSMATTYLSIDKSKIEHLPSSTDVGDTTFAELKLLQAKLATEFKHPSIPGNQTES